jgi:hypothetical protein
MTLRRLSFVAGLLLGVAWGARAGAAPAYSIKTASDKAPPKELAEPVRKLLEARCVRLLDGKGTVLAEVWFRKDVPVKATEAQIKNGLTYNELPQSTVVGALRVPKEVSDYRKQKIPAGVYTLRYGLQPMDGDHMGTAPTNFFLLASPAGEDKKPDLLAVKPLQELSAKVTGDHPAVFLLFEGKGAGKEPKLVTRNTDHQVLLIRLNASSGGKKATLDIGLTLVGASASA